MFEILQGENPDTSPPDEHKEVRESGFDYLDDNNYSMKSDQVKSGDYNAMIWSRDNIFILLQASAALAA